MTMTGLTPAEFTAALTAALHRLRVRRIQALFRRAHTHLVFMHECETHTQRGGGGEISCASGAATHGNLTQRVPASG